MTVVKATVEVEMPSEEVEPFLQALRGWERARPEILMAVKIDARAEASPDVAAIFNRLKPALPFQVMIPNTPTKEDSE